ncbi:hypothetical protein [Aneurinibacillus thermoaerophilus]|uniref:hypothetical protein n=1 Tax=Aneurinibacillus thermoaerophilus TaxID=143495 RepID=UPI002E233AFF|nr:hypothetical protein [Aneurinibacillus thermoaerophilus]
MAENIQPDTTETNVPEIITPERQKKRQRMKQLLQQHFEGTVLYKKYEEHGLLDTLFTDRILDMEENVLYSSKEVAQILETEHHNINNKRREFVDYIAPKMKMPNSKHWKHDYIGVFKLKMIDGLTGQNGLYTLKQVKLMLYGKLEHEGETPPHDAMYQLVDFQEKLFSSIGYEATERVFKTLSNPEIIERILALDDSLKRIENYEQKLLTNPNEEITRKIENLERKVEETQKIEKANQQINEVKKKCNRIFEQINKHGIPLHEIEIAAAKYEEMLNKHPEHRDIIILYQNYAVNKINDLKDAADKEVKERAFALYKKIEDENITQEEMRQLLDKLEAIAHDNPDMHDELFIYLANSKTRLRTLRQMQQESPKKKKGWFARLFGK